MTMGQSIHLVIPIVFALKHVLSTAPPEMTTVQVEQPILPTFGLNWCVSTTGNNSNFRHFINCSTEGSFMDLMGIKQGDEIMSIYLTLTNRYDHEQLLSLLNGIQQNRIFELIYRRDLFDMNSVLLPCYYSLGLLEEIDRRLENVWWRYRFTYIRARITLASTQKPGRKRRSSAVRYKVDIIDKEKYFPGRTTLKIPPLVASIGTNSDNFICVRDPLVSCSSAQRFELQVTSDFNSRIIYSRFCLTAPDRCITATGETDIEIRSANFSAEDATYFILHVEDVEQLRYTLRSMVYPLHYMYEMDTHQIRGKALNITIGAIELFLEAFFQLWPH